MDPELARRSFPIGRRNIPSLANASIASVQIVLIFLCFHLATRVSSGWPLAALAVAFGILLNSVYSIIHEAEHAMLFRTKRYNDGAGVLMALFFPAPFHLLRQGHIGHHLRNRSDDEAFDLYFDGDHVLWRFLVWYGILTGFYYIVVVLSNVVAVFAPFVLDRNHFRIDELAKADRPSSAFLESFNPSYLRWIRLEAAAAILLHAGIVRVMGIPLGRYAAMYASFGVMWSAMQYVHHYGTERHVARGARNLRIFGPLDALWLNHNWHRVHHENPTVPWIHLPDLAPDGERRGFLPWMYVKMWKGPRRTQEHVANRFAGRILP